MSLQWVGEVVFAAICVGVGFWVGFGAGWWSARDYYIYDKFGLKMRIRHRLE